MKFRLPILLSVVILVAFGAYSATRAFDPPKSGSSASNDGDAAKDESAKTDANTKKSNILSKSKKMSDPFNKLTEEEAYVILRKGTEAREKGYTHSKVVGTYICKRCNAPLYNSTDKFESHCGWPSFDDEIKGSVKRQLESDGSMRIEIVCQNCGGHLGHVFEGERYTAKNSRHCVNSISMKLIAKGKEMPKVIKPETEEAPSIRAEAKSGKGDGNPTPVKKSEK